jgi:hypothetical protein
VGGGVHLDIEFSDGRVAATSDGGRTAPPAEKAKPRMRGGGRGSGGQGSLFGS